MRRVVSRVWRLPVVIAAFGATLAIGALSAGVAAAQAPQITATPGLFPAFNAAVTDYVTRCQPANQVQVAVTAPAGTSVSVDNSPAQTGSFGQNVILSAGQEFTITVTEAVQATTYYVRCLPSDFPGFTATRTGPTQAAFYVVTPNGFLPPAGISWQYVAFFDNNGVPVWWMKSAGKTFPYDAKLLPNGDVIWTHGWGYGGAGAEEHQLDGTLVRNVYSVGASTDSHDIELLPNGDYLVGRIFPVNGVDMSSCGGPTSGRLMDFELQEVTPTGGLVWSWRASDHIPVSEVAPQWKVNCKSGGDVYHWNAVAPDGAGGYLLSFRSLNAIYRIDAATGAIDWKLGGTSTPESLTVLGDPSHPNNPLCGQHNVRVLPDGTITVYDDGSGCFRRPRAVRFAIDTSARTATLLQSLTNPNVASSWWAGSTQVLPGGDWVTSWGATQYVTEQNASGAIIYQLKFTQYLPSYRVNAVLPGQVSIEALRAGMDAQYPRP